MLALNDDLIEYIFIHLLAIAVQQLFNNEILFIDDHNNKDEFLCSTKSIYTFPHDGLLIARILSKNILNFAASSARIRGVFNKIKNRFTTATIISINELIYYKDRNSMTAEGVIKKLRYIPSPLNIHEEEEYKMYILYFIDIRLPFAATTIRSSILRRREIQKCISSLYVSNLNSNGNIKIFGNRIGIPQFEISTSIINFPGTKDFTGRNTCISFNPEGAYISHPFNHFKYIKFYKYHPFFVTQKIEFYPQRIFGGIKWMISIVFSNEIMNLNNDSDRDNSYHFSLRMTPRPILNSEKYCDKSYQEISFEKTMELNGELAADLHEELTEFTSKNIHEEIIKSIVNFIDECLKNTIINEINDNFDHENVKFWPHIKKLLYFNQSIK